MDQGTERGGILAGAYRATTIGSFALIFLGAFEALAVTTIMPTVAEELRGQAFFAVAFAATIAASVIGMVAAGRWSDGSGPVAPLVAGGAVFVVGLVLSGTALEMGVFVVGRFLQGLGNGAIIVALYVVVARIFPARLHPAIFGAFAAAWVVPSMIGPPVAGLLARLASWHWVFLGVGVLVLGAGALMLPAIRRLRAQDAAGDAEAGGADGADAAAAPRALPAAAAIALAVVVSLAVVGVSLGGELPGWWGWAAAGAALVVAIAAMRPLLPRRTLLVARGLGATIFLRGAVAAAFFAAEVHLPYLLQERDGLTPEAAGLILTVGAVSWAAGSHIQGRLGDRLPDRRATVLGAALVTAGLATVLLTVVAGLPFPLVAVGWLVAGSGMGTVFPRISSLVLAYSTTRTQGANSSAMTLFDAAAAATSIAIAGLLFQSLGGATATASFVAVLVLATAAGVGAILVARRVVPRG
jgi:MFS family permease